MNCAVVSQVHQAWKCRGWVAHGTGKIPLRFSMIQSKGYGSKEKVDSKN